MNRDIYGFLIGLGAGVSLGILLAPRSGERTRSLIREKANDSVAYLRQQGSDACDAAADAIRGSTQKVTKGAEAVRAAVEVGKKAFNESMQS
jgi:gas vesicle protein